MFSTEWIFPVLQQQALETSTSQTRLQKLLMQGRASFRISSLTASGILGNSRFLRLCMEIPIPKEKVKRLHEGWDLFRLPPALCLIVSCSQTAASAPPIPVDTCPASLGNIKEKIPHGGEDGSWND